MLVHLPAVAAVEAFKNIASNICSSNNADVDGYEVTCSNCFIT